MKKEDKEALREKIVNHFHEGKEIRQISDLTEVCYNTVRNYLIKSNINPSRIRTKLTLTYIQKKQIVEFYLKGQKIAEIAECFNIKPYNVSNLLLKKGIKRTRSGKHKGGFTEKEKQKIISLYTEEHRGKSYIGKMFNRSGYCISYYLKKWSVPNIERSLICKKIRNIYGSTKGFSGKNHKPESKIKTSISGKNNWKTTNREPKISKSQTFNTKIGKVLGTYEVAYLQKLYDSGKSLPKKGKKIQTPFGSYTPDFDFGNKFIEIKSEYTLKASKGELEYCGNYSKQYEKIKWVINNIKKVEVTVLQPKEAYKFFKKATLEKKVLLDDVTFIKNKAKIIKRSVLCGT